MSEKCPICGDTPDYDVFEHLADVHDAIELARAVQAQANRISSLARWVESVPPEANWDTYCHLRDDMGAHRHGVDIGYARAVEVVRQSLSQKGPNR